MYLYRPMYVQNALAPPRPCTHFLSMVNIGKFANFHVHVLYEQPLNECQISFSAFRPVPARIRLGRKRSDDTREMTQLEFVIPAVRILSANISYTSVDFSSWIQ